MADRRENGHNPRERRSGSGTRRALIWSYPVGQEGKGPLVDVKRRKKPRGRRGEGDRRMRDVDHIPQRRTSYVDRRGIYSQFPRRSRPDRRAQ